MFGGELLFVKEVADGEFQKTYLVKKNNKMTSIKNENLDDEEKIKIGSLWKLFSYVYLVENNQKVEDYQCTGKLEDERFCCDRGYSINMDMSLIKSCGLYFDVSRVQIDSVLWDKFWSEKMQSPFPWLSNYKNLTANSEASIKELLIALKRLRLFVKNRERIEDTLSRVTVAGTGKQGLVGLGTTLKFKTFTWAKKGGLAGWGADGSTFLAISAGKSSKVLEEWSSDIAQMMNVSSVNSKGANVRVKFFAQYPIKMINNLDTRKEVKEGVMSPGKYEVIFQNGNRLNVTSNNQLQVVKKNSQIQIYGKFTIDEYVARVIDREISPSPEEAAKAFSILIRTYLLNNSHKSFNVYEIDDSSRFQRVSPSVPTKEALKIANWGHNLVLKNTPHLTYHLSEDAPHRLSWARAIMMAKNNENFLSILNSQYDSNNLSFLNDSSDQCRPLEVLQKWVNNNKKKWQKVLSGIQGFSEPKKVVVCQSNNGKQYADLENDTIYVNFQNNSEDLITTAHEYLHLAYKNHPRTNDEDEIESLARKLVLNLEEKK